ncbi:DENN domain-containing protein 1A-like [Histomonas meleagridis]|uniref:DENN domain-containing protein 1A-like n=1 Tax=Histomonas meleagridis TaxID=135588 RepID=UPI003559B695|nr:DENN domain-containing protein 1A-like [Histomonas meleagridis]
MLSFLTEQDFLFEYVYNVVQGSESVSIYQKTSEVPESISNNLKTFCFPFEKCDIKNLEQFNFAFTDSDRKLLFAFVHYHIAEDNKIHAYCLISKRYHPTLYSEIISNIAGLDKIQQKEYISEVINLKLNVFPYDNTLDTAAASLLNIKSIDHLSPSNELLKIYLYLFSKYNITDILHCTVAMLFDYRIIVVSSSAKVLSDTAFSLLGLLYPLTWPGSFIPILPAAIQTALEAPFSFIIGLHSSLSLNLLNDNRYFVINADARYTSTVGIENLPQNLNDLIDRTSENIRMTLKKYWPMFPFKKLQNKFRKFITNFMGEVYSVDPKQPQQIYNSFTKFSSKNSNELPTVFSQTQFIDQFMRICFVEKDKNTIELFWSTPRGASNNIRTENKEDTNTSLRKIQNETYNRKSVTIAAFGLQHRRSNSITSNFESAEKKRRRKHRTTPTDTTTDAQQQKPHHRKHRKTTRNSLTYIDPLNMNLQENRTRAISGTSYTDTNSEKDLPISDEEGNPIKFVKFV